jgi:hypothetical protein
MCIALSHYPPLTLALIAASMRPRSTVAILTLP